MDGGREARCIWKFGVEMLKIRDVVNSNVYHVMR